MRALAFILSMIAAGFALVFGVLTLNPAAIFEAFLIGGTGTLASLDQDDSK
jgi:hypothetical protein